MISPMADPKVRRNVANFMSLIFKQLNDIKEGNLITNLADNTFRDYNTKISSEVLKVA